MSRGPARSDATETCWHAFGDAFRGPLARMQLAGCRFALIASVMPHVPIDAIWAGLTMRVLAMRHAAAEALRKRRFPNPQDALESIP